MSLARLLEAVPPSVAPTCVFSGPWEPVEAEIGVSLPQDYKDFCAVYGRGRFMELLYVNLPGRADQRGTLEGELDLACEMVNYGVPVPYPVWPEPGGLLNVGLTEFNDRIFWLTQGDPCDWRIVVWDRALQTLETFDCGLTEFLAGLAAGSIAPEGFSGRTRPSEPVFEPGLGPPGLVWAKGERNGPRLRPGIEALERVVAPPPKPVGSFDGPWKPVETYLGTALPQDYKDFARLYGYGLFLHVLIVHVPSADNPDATLETQVRETSYWFGKDRDHRYPLWPRLGGLINFGVTENGDYLFWLPIGPPDEWKVVFWDRGLSEDECFETFDCGMAAFLAGLADGSILPRGHEREDLEPIEPIFRPHGDRSET